MGKKKNKKRFVTNDMKGDLSDQILVSDSALEEMIRKQYGLKGPVEDARAFCGEAPDPTYQHVTDFDTGDGFFQQRERTPMPMTDMSVTPKVQQHYGYPNATTPEITEEDVRKGVEKIERENADLRVVFTESGRPSVQDIEIGGKVYLAVHDWAGNRMMIPYASEGADDFSVKNIPLMNDGRSDEEQIQGTLISLGFAMASSQVHWGMPSLVMDAEEFHEEVLHHDLDMFDARYTSICISDDAPGYVLGYIIPEDLVDEWIDIISAHMDDPDALILTLFMLQRQLHETRWINYKEMTSALVSYLEDIVTEEEIESFFEFIKSNYDFDDDGVLQNVEFMSPLTSAADIDEYMVYGLGTVFNPFREDTSSDPDYDNEDGPDVADSDDNPYDDAPNGAEAAMTPEALAAWAEQYNSEHKLGGYVNKEADIAEREGASVDDASFPEDTTDAGADLPNSSAETDNVQVHNEHAVSDGNGNGHSDPVDDRNVSSVEGEREGSKEVSKEGETQPVGREQASVPSKEEVKEEERREDASEAHEVQKAEAGKTEEKVDDDDRMIIGVSKS